MKKKHRISISKVLDSIEAKIDKPIRDYNEMFPVGSLNEECQSVPILLSDLAEIGGQIAAIRCWIGEVNYERESNL